MISIIIPTYNEEKNIASTIDCLWKHSDAGHIREIIVADGQSNDNTIKIALEAEAKVLISPKKGRAAQMNFGASRAQGKILYFIHADTLPPPGFSKDILKAYQKGFKCGCFMLSFDRSHWFLKAHSWFTRFNNTYFRFGDQSLFVEKALFDKIKGFDEKLIVCEDQEIIKRLTHYARFTVIKKAVTTSARKYMENGVYKTQGVFYLIYFMYKAGYSQQRLVRTYRRLMRQNKI